MNTEIIVAIIGFLGVGLTSILTTVVQIKKLKADQKDTIQKSLEANRDEYLRGIAEVKDSIQDVKENLSEVKATYQTTVATLTLQISNLEKKQDKHNSVIERTYALERDIEVLKNRESVSEHRLYDIENSKKGDLT